jgi:hypothetical protein
MKLDSKSSSYIAFNILEEMQFNLNNRDTLMNTCSVLATQGETDGELKLSRHLGGLGLGLMWKTAAMIDSFPHPASK